MDIGKLRYHALWAYTGLLAGMVFLDKLPLNEATATAILLPIAGVVGADMLKHKDNSA